MSRPRSNIQVPETENLLSAELMRLKDMTWRLGTLYELQVQQLKIWPRVALPHSIESVAHVHIGQCSVTFQIRTSGKPPHDLPKRLAGLVESVRLMLGDYWLVRVKEGSKVIYSGKRKIPVPTRKDFTGTDFEAGRHVPKTPWQFQKPPSLK